MPAIKNPHLKQGFFVDFFKQDMIDINKKSLIGSY
jgi:hypothetical protein